MMLAIGVYLGVAVGLAGIGVGLAMHKDEDGWGAVIGAAAWPLVLPVALIAGITKRIVEARDAKSERPPQ